MDGLSAKVQEILQSGAVFERLNDWYNIGPVQRATLEEFTVQVVKECVKVSKDTPWFSESPSNGWRNPINHVCNVIKEHFGIKETL